VTVQRLELLAELSVHQALPCPSANHTACGFSVFFEFRCDVHYTYAISLHGKCRQRFPRLHNIRSLPLPAKSATWTPKNAAPSLMNLTVSISRAFKARTPTEFTDEYHTLIWIWYLVLLGLGPSQSPQRQPPWTLAHPRFRDGALCGLDMSPLPQRSPPFS